MSMTFEQKGFPIYYDKTSRGLNANRKSFVQSSLVRELSDFHNQHQAQAHLALAVRFPTKTTSLGFKHEDVHFSPTKREDLSMAVATALSVMQTVQDGKEAYQQKLVELKLQAARAQRELVQLKATKVPSLDSVLQPSIASAIPVLLFPMPKWLSVAILSVGSVILAVPFAKSVYNFVKGVLAQKKEISTREQELGMLGSAIRGFDDAITREFDGALEILKVRVERFEQSELLAQEMAQVRAFYAQQK
ncbi:MAG: hypothetical protein AABX38_08100 [Candidatus Micrarchaeota archaeon]